MHRGDRSAWLAVRDHQGLHCRLKGVVLEMHLDAVWQQPKGNGRGYRTSPSSRS
jgi:hypothetical protein